MKPLKQACTDKAQEILRCESPFASSFKPDREAVIGGTKMAGNVGHTILWNLIWSPFWRTVHAVLVQQVVEIGHQEKLGKIPAEIIVENVVMQRVCKKLGFHVYREPQHGRVSAELSLSEQAAKWAGSR